MRRYGKWFAFGLLFAAGAAMAAPPITGDPGATYDDLIGEKALVTVILKGGGRDPNLRIRGIYETTIALETASGEAIAYPVSEVREIRVQNGRVESGQPPRAQGVLTSDDRELVARAAERALELSNQSNANQAVKMGAAMALAASDHAEAEIAQGYLHRLAGQNDAETAMLAATYLWALGDPLSDELIQEGFLSGSRNARAMAATLAGLMGKEQFLPEVRQLVRDPAVELYPAGAKAAGRLKDRESLTQLYDGLRALRDVKAEAAVFALKLIDGPEVRQKMLDMKGDARGMEWFRVIRVLYALGDPQAKTILIEEALRQPAFQKQAALILAEDRVVEAIDFLRDYLDRPEDPNFENLVYRAMVGIALFEAGDLQAKVILQELLDKQPNEIYARGRTGDVEFKRQTVAALQQVVCNMIGNAQHRDLLSLLGAPMQSTNPDVALAACTAAMQIANQEFGQRLKEARQ